ncbi:hypothetical protein GCM10023322_31690 [Rugosimonospora acidiphila]|uniref:FAD-binding domain-containing protein n=1 Tax=Rugosimonospora acidiphila TaxID=556531 RepID=A0ABP9RS58_9ACTN
MDVLIAGAEPQTLEVFGDLGVAAGAVAAGRLPTHTRVHLGGAELTDFAITQQAPSPSKRYPDSVALAQWRTEGLLRDALSDHGLDVEFGTRLAGFEADRGGVTSELNGRSGTEWARAGYLVGCDGGTARYAGSSACRLRYDQRRAAGAAGRPRCGRPARHRYHLHPAQPGARSCCGRRAVTHVHSLEGVTRRPSASR